MLKFQDFLNEKITSDNKEPIDHLAHYLKDHKCTNIEKVPSKKYVEYKSPKSFGLSCKFYSYKYFIWLDFDDADTKLLYHVVDIDKIKKNEPLEPESFVSASEVAEYVSGKK
jgi:hypothetical protein